MPAVRINEVLAYILGLDIYRADGQRQMAAIKAEVSRAHPEGQSLIRVAVARTLATTDPSEILAALKKRHENYTKLPFLSVDTALDKLLAAAPPLARSKMSAAEKAYKKKQATLSAEMVAANRAYKKKHGMSKTEAFIAPLTRKKNPPLTPAQKRAFLHDLVSKRYMTREAAEAFIEREARSASRKNPKRPANTTLFDKLVDALTERGVDFEVTNIFSVPTLMVFSASDDQTMVQVFRDDQGEEEIHILGRSFQSAPVAALTLARIAALQ